MTTFRRTEHKLSEQKERCGHCGVDTLMLAICEGEHTETTDDPRIGSFWITSNYRVLLCPACYEVTVLHEMSDSEHWRSGDTDDDEILEVTTKYLYPELSVDPPGALPAVIDRSLRVAVRLRKSEPIASAVFSRKALEAVCVNKGFTRGALSARIDALAESGAIPALLRKRLTQFVCLEMKQRMM